MFRRPTAIRSFLVVLTCVMALITTSPAIAVASEETTATLAESTAYVASLETYGEQRLAAAHDDARRRYGGSAVRAAGTTELIWSAELAELARSSSRRVARLGALEHDPAIRDALCCSGRFSNNIGFSGTSGRASVVNVRGATTRLIDKWLASGGHRANLLDPAVTHVGVGVHMGTDGRLWATVVFQERTASTASNAAQPTTSDRWCPVTARSGRFVDVDNVHTDAIDCLTALDIVRGVSEERFDPAGTVSRGQLAMLLDRTLTTLEVPRPAALPDAFFDVGSGVHSAPAIGRLAGAGIVLGRADGWFVAGAPVTRGQVAVQLEAVRRSVHGEVEVGPRSRFADVPTTRRFSRSIDAGANAGLLTGVDPGRFEPDAPLRRDQAASLLLRFLEFESR